MHRARAFFYVCAGVFLLALSYHLGARSAGAQAPGATIAGYTAPGTFGWHYVITQDGSVYGRLAGSGDRLSPGVAVFMGNFWGDVPVPAQHETFGALKSRYRGAPGATQPTSQDR